jgi:predicted RNA-binding protein with TRAM domain
MVEIPDSLRSVFTATVRRVDGSYVVEVPDTEVDNDALAVGDAYRVAVLDANDAPGARESSTETAGRRTTGGGGTGPGGHDRGADRDPPAPPVDEGEVRDVSIETVGDQGDGIAKVDRGYVVIVPGAEPGDEPTVRIDQVQQNVAFASVVDRDV